MTLDTLQKDGQTEYERLKRIAEQYPTVNNWADAMGAAMNLDDYHYCRQRSIKSAGVNVR